MLRFLNGHQVWHLTLAIIMLLVLVTNTHATSTVPPTRGHGQHVRRLHQHDTKIMTKAVSHDVSVTPTAADQINTTLQHSDHSLQKRGCLLWVSGICVWWWNQNAVTGTISPISSSAPTAAGSAPVLAAVNATSTTVLDYAASGANSAPVTSATDVVTSTYAGAPTATAPSTNTSMSTSFDNSTLTS